jgi:ABC-type uncharacterized transport system substrate-binding protein
MIFRRSRNAGERATLRICSYLIYAVLVFVPGSATAHPHVWVTVRSEIVFSSDGLLTAVRHDWTFDEMYSAFAAQGLAKPGELAKREQFAPLAKENAEALTQVGYYTVLKISGKQAEFGEPTDYWMEEQPDHKVTFHVVVPLKTPQQTGRFVTMMVSDPEFFIDFEFDEKDPVKLDNPPSGCSLSVTHPKPLDVEDSKKLNESFFTNLSPGAGFGFKLASRAIIACPNWGQR